MAKGGRSLTRVLPIVGGNWNNGANAGLWNVSCGYAASGTDTTIGGRLAKV